MWTKHQWHCGSELIRVKSCLRSLRLRDAYASTTCTGVHVPRSVRVLLALPHFDKRSAVCSSTSRCSSDIPLRSARYSSRFASPMDQKDDGGMLTWIFVRHCGEQPRPRSHRRIQNSRKQPQIGNGDVPTCTRRISSPLKPSGGMGKTRPSSSIDISPLTVLPSWYVCSSSGAPLQTITTLRSTRLAILRPLGRGRCRGGVMLVNSRLHTGQLVVLFSRQDRRHLKWYRCPQLVMNIACSPCSISHRHTGQQSLSADAVAGISSTGLDDDTSPGDSCSNPWRFAPLSIAESGFRF